MDPSTIASGIDTEQMRIVTPNPFRIRVQFSAIIEKSRFMEVSR